MKENSNKPAVATSRFGGALVLLLLSVAFHSCYLFSIFDIYFVSPVTSVDIRYGVGAELERGGPGGRVGEGLAKRVVLIVGDGLRADKLFQTYPAPPFPYSDPLPSAVPNSPHILVSKNSTTPAPFIRNLIQSRQAAWGVSNTRVPTESRPGHVALIGGMYEDVSAVTRGWQANPVSFDSVFNQSSHTFSFGSPDILPMFKDGASDPNKVDTWSYGEEAEDFSVDAVALDLWVLDQLKLLLHNATTSPELDKTLRANGTVFFLHLLGLDTTGHSYRPHGPEYHRNIRVVDYVVSETVRLLDEFYEDDKATSFVFTADHGMSSKGNHGDGELDNTRTPLVVWGAGVDAKGEAEGHDAYSADWGLEGTRKDVEQADVAVLMSVLGGLSIPANSAGRVPLQYLDASPSFKARAAFANANQVLAEFVVKSRFKEEHAISFRPFPPRADSESVETKSVASHKADIEALIFSGDFKKAEIESMNLLKIGLDGVRYFQTYDWFTLRSIVAIGYLGSMVYSADFVLRTHIYSHPTSSPSSPSIAITLAGAAVFLALSARFIIERAPASYYLYAAFPSYFWTSVLRDPWAIKSLLSPAEKSSPTSIIVFPVLVVGVLQLMVYGYQERSIFAAILFGIAWLWPQIAMSTAFQKENASLLRAWGGACSMLAVFPLLPVEKGENLLIIMAGGLIFLILGYGGLDYTRRSALVERPSPTLAKTRRMVQIELLLTGGAMVVTWSSGRSLQLKKGLPLLNQILGWTILVAASCIPILHGRPRSQPFLERLMVLLFSFTPAFIILSLSYEGLFYSAFVTTLMLWIPLESKLASSRIRTTSKNTLDAQSVRIALFFLTFLHVAFFGVGNIASISSFYLEPVYRLIPVFAPFPMAALLLFKLLTPFVALSGVSSVLNHQLNLPPFALFIVASTLCDVLTINFFFLVSDEGSWLEIGTTISNFAICSLLGIFNTALYLGGEAALAYAV